MSTRQSQMSETQELRLRSTEAQGNWLSTRKLHCPLLVQSPCFAASIEHVQEVLGRIGAELVGEPPFHADDLYPPKVHRNHPRCSLKDSGGPAIEYPLPVRAVSPCSQGWQQVFDLGLYTSKHRTNNNDIETEAVPTGVRHGHNKEGTKIGKHQTW